MRKSLAIILAAMALSACNDSYQVDSAARSFTDACKSSTVHYQVNTTTKPRTFSVTCEGDE